MRVLFKRRAHVGREQAPVRVETIRRGGVEFAHQREDLPDVALHVLYRNIEALVACALLELGPDLVRLGDLRDREVAVNLGLHVIDAGEFGEALGPALHRCLVPLEVCEQRLEAGDEPVEMRVSLDRDLLGEARSEENTSDLQSLMRMSYAVVL